MKPLQGFDPAGRSVIVIAALVIILAGVKAASGIINPLLMAAFISILCAPALALLQRKGMPTTLALLLILVMIFLVGGFMAGMLGASLEAVTDSLPSYREKLVRTFSEMADRLRSWHAPLPFETFREAVNADSVMRVFNFALSGLGGLLANAMTVFLAVIFMLLEVTHFPEKLQVALKNPEHSLAQLSEFNRKVVRYLVLKALLSALTGLLVALILWLLGIDFVFLWALLAFFLNFIPYVGSLIAAVPPILLAMVDQGALAALWVALGYTAVNFFVGNILETEIMGVQMDLSALVVLISLLFWGWLLGPVGVFLSIPLTMLITIGLESHPSTRRFALLLRSSP